MKVLIIRFSSIGDIVLTTPIIRCLKQQHPSYVVHYLTKPSFASLLVNNPYIDQLLLLDDKLQNTIERLKLEHYDLVIDLHNNIRTTQIKQALEVKSYAYPKLNIEKWLYTNIKVNFLPDKSIVERYLETVKSLKVHNDGAGLDYFIPSEANVGNNDIPMSHWAGYITCVIGGSMATKKLPVAQWKTFCSIFPYPIILLGGPEDAAEGNEIATIDPIKVYNACGKFSIDEAASLMQYAQIVIANDTGLMHIATALKKPMISLWGNTTPEMGMFPYYGYNNLKERVHPMSMILENKSLGCRPCSKIGYQKCPKKHFKCMQQLDMQQLNTMAIQLWNKANKK